MKKTLDKVSHTNLQNSCPQPVINLSIFWYFYLILRFPYVADHLTSSQHLFMILEVAALGTICSSLAPRQPSVLTAVHAHSIPLPFV